MEDYKLRIILFVLVKLTLRILIFNNFNCFSHFSSLLLRYMYYYYYYNQAILSFHLHYLLLILNKIIYGKITVIYKNFRNFNYISFISFK